MQRRPCPPQCPAHTWSGSATGATAGSPTAPSSSTSSRALFSAWMVRTRRSHQTCRTWWTDLRATLTAIGAVDTGRQAVRQKWIDRRFPEFLGIPGPTIEQWTTAHGDFHWGNITGNPLVVLDWEGWGRAPAGYDAGLLHAYSLRVPELAERVRVELAPILETRAGRIGELVALAELLQVNARGWHPELGGAWAARAEKLTGVRPPARGERFRRPGVHRVRARPNRSRSAASAVSRYASMRAASADCGSGSSPSRRTASP